MNAMDLFHFNLSKCSFSVRSERLRCRRGCRCHRLLAAPNAGKLQNHLCDRRLGRIYALCENVRCPMLCAWRNQVYCQSKRYKIDLLYDQIWHALPASHDALRIRVRIASLYVWLCASVCVSRGSNASQQYCLSADTNICRSSVEFMPCSHCCAADSFILHFLGWFFGSAFVVCTCATDTLRLSRAERIPMRK